MCKFPTHSFACVPEFHNCADFSPLVSRLWKARVVYMRSAFGRQASQTLETPTVRQNCQPSNNFCASGGLFAAWLRLDSQDRHNARAKEGFECLLSRCWRTPAFSERPRYADGMSLLLMLSVSSRLKVVSATSTPSRRSATSSRSSESGRFVQGEPFSFCSSAFDGVRSVACSSVQVPQRVSYKVSGYVCGKLTSSGGTATGTWLV